MCWQLPGSTYLYMHIIIIFDIISDQNNFEGREEMGGERVKPFSLPRPLAALQWLKVSYDVMLMYSVHKTSLILITNLFNFR